MFSKNKNKRTKRLLTIFAILIIFGSIFYFAPAVFAEDFGLTEVGDASGLEKGDLRVTIGNIIKIILGFVGVIALGLVMYGGFLYMTSGGEETKVTKAKQYLINATIGLVIIFSAYAIVSFIMNTLIDSQSSAGTYQCADGKDNDGDGFSDFPNDDGCTSATDYSEYGGGDVIITGGGQLRATSITPQGDQTILNVHPRIVLNRKVLSDTVNETNVSITSSNGVVNTTIVEPIEVTESLGNGAQILEDIKTEDGVRSSNWLVCSATYLGDTPMVVKYDISSIANPTGGTINFESIISNVGATMDLSCGNTPDAGFVIKQSWLPPDGGKTSLVLPSTCLQGDEVYLKWKRIGNNCVKFDYMLLAIENQKAEGTLVLKSGGRVIEFVPSGECSEEDPDAYGLKKDTEYTITLKPKGLTSTQGYELSCGPGSVCLAKFTTGSVCDTEAPQIIFNNLHNKKSICQLPVTADEMAEETYDPLDLKYSYFVDLQAIDDSAVSLVSLFVDELGEDDAIGVAGPSGTTPTDTLDAVIPWPVNAYPLGEHQVRATANDIDGNVKSKDLKVYLKPEQCCDAEGIIICGDPACGACDGDACTEDADCAHGECLEGRCVSFPVINNANPKEGAVGNFVTITGSGFGEYDAAISKVYFSNGIDEAGKYSLEAELPESCGSGAWKKSQIIVKVPENVGTGPIKVINKDSKYDDTENEFGWEGEFFLNPNFKYPGLCTISPEDGSPTDLTQLEGEGFGTKDANDFVYFGTTKGTLTGAWSDGLLVGVRVPQINKSIYKVVVGKGQVCQKAIEDCEAGAESCFESCPGDEVLVDGCTVTEGVCDCNTPDEIESLGACYVAADPDCVCSDIFSNPVNFTIDEAEVFPTITNIGPKVCTKPGFASCDEGTEDCVCIEGAPDGQLITVSGSGFGKSIGQVIFIPVVDSGDGFVQMQTAGGDPEPAFIGVPACGDGSWTDNQIIIKVPFNKTVGDPSETIPIALGNYWVRVVRPEGPTSNARDFVINGNAPGPGICSITPNNGPTGIKFSLIGENFGDSNGPVPGNQFSYQVSFVKNADERTNVLTMDSWSNESIIDAVVPDDAISGEVKITSSADSSIKSNPVQFNVGACSEDSCGDSEFCCFDGVCTGAVVGETKADVCGDTIISYNSEFAWIMSTGIIPKIPKVINRTCSTGDFGYPQSVSPKDDVEMACPNALISATFNMLLEPATLDGNVLIKRCLVEGQACDLDLCSPSDCVERTVNDVNDDDITGEYHPAGNEIGVPASITCLKEGASCEAGSDGCVCNSSESYTSFSLNLTFLDEELSLLSDYSDVMTAEKKMYPDTWYQVEINGGTGGITAPSLPGGTGGKEMKNNYVWKFKTQSTDCEPDNFLMKPAKGKIKAIEGLQQYWVTGLAGCEEVSVADKDWVWDVPEAGDASKAVAKGYACASSEGLYCNSPEDIHTDRGIFGLNASALTCLYSGGGVCDPYTDEDCECDVLEEIETASDNPVNILASVVTESTTYQKGAVLDIDFSDPRVTSYYPVCEEACVNAQIGVNFNTKMQKAALEDSSDVLVKVYSCFAKDCVSLVEVAQEKFTRFYTYNPPSPGSLMESLLTLDLVNDNLAPNKYYRVVVSGEAKSYSSVPLTGLNYADANSPELGIDSFSWIFKTKNDPNECVIDTVGVKPVNYVAGLPGENIKYVAQPCSKPDTCNADGQLLDPFSYPWTWTVNNPAEYIDSNDNVPLATITNNVYSSQNLNICTDKCVKKGSQQYLAVCGDGDVDLGEECDGGATCDPITCLLLPFSTCTDSNGNADLSDESNCCGNGTLNTDEECDQGCEYLDSDNEACSPGDMDCSCVSKGKACSSGCLNLGTATGYTCGNGVVEPGEDADDGNTQNGDGINSKCLYEGAQAKSSADLAVCGDGVVELGEECETTDTNCSSTCTWLGFEACSDELTSNCCGNGGALEGGEECEKTSCSVTVDCGIEVEMAKCGGVLGGVLVDGCSVTEGVCDCSTPDETEDLADCYTLPDTGCALDESDTCVCAEANTCDNNGKMQVGCAPGADNCVCDFPAWCSTKCTNLGSSASYGSVCGNGGAAENGEDPDCEGTGDATVGAGSPYQVATINDATTTYNGVDVYDVILTLDKELNLNFYSDKNKVSVSTEETIEGASVIKEGDTDLSLRVSESTYLKAAEDACTGVDTWSVNSSPTQSATDVCLNAAITLSTDSDVDSSDANVVFYFHNDTVECPTGYEEYVINEASFGADANWLEKAYSKVKTFVRGLLFKVGLAEAPYLCKVNYNEQLITKQIGAAVQYLPTELLLPNTDYTIDISNMKNTCGTVLDPYQLNFHTSNELCRLSKVTVTPPNPFLMKADMSTEFTATAVSNTGQPVTPHPGIYDWDWSWLSSDPGVASVPATGGAVVNSVTNTKNGKTIISATATITEDALGLACPPDVAECSPLLPGCACTYDSSQTNGATYTGYANLTVFICDNPWFGDITDFTDGAAYNAIIPTDYKFNYAWPETTPAEKKAKYHKRFDINYVETSDGSLQPSYLVEKEHNVGLFYCRDFGEQGVVSDDLPLIGLDRGDFTEIAPEPRHGVYFDRNFDYVMSGEDFSEMDTGPWTISTWVYNDDLPTDRYVRLFYKNLGDGNLSLPYDADQDHVEIAMRSWAVCNGDVIGNSGLESTTVCWLDVLSGEKEPEECTCGYTKRSIVYRIKKGGFESYQGVQLDAGLLSDGFNRITLSFNGSNEAKLYINYQDVAASTVKEDTPMYVWPRNDVEANPVTVGDDYGKVFIGGLGKTGVPLTSFGGYIDEVKIWNSVKTPADILASDTTPIAEQDLLGFWDFDTNVNNSVGQGATSHCTADYDFGGASSKCLPGENFAHINITNIAMEKGLLSSGAAWLEVAQDLENQCNDGLDNDHNGQTDMQDPKCRDDFDGWEEPELFAQYFFVRKVDETSLGEADDVFSMTNDYAPDAISLRIYENPEYLRPQDWYGRYAPNPASGVQVIDSDCLSDAFGEYCYKGIKDGRTVYVGAANVAGSNVYNNIYLLSYSQGANTATQNIFSQLVQFLRFNMNISGSSSYTKAEVIRDNQRTMDMVLMRQYIGLYRQQNGQVPQLDGGTLQRHHSNSIWDSWATEMSVVGQMPVDPINKLAWQPPAYRYFTPADAPCNYGDDGCNYSEGADGNRTVTCGTDAEGIEKACYSNEQCVIPGEMCVLCAGAEAPAGVGVYDPKSCYRGSTQTLSNVYNYNTLADISALDQTAQDALAGIMYNRFYSYEANASDTTQYRLKMNMETTSGANALTYKYVPEYATPVGGWDGLAVDPMVVLEAVPASGDLPECSNGIDDDGNGKIDFPNDDGCTDAFDDTEEYPYQCKNDFDDDGDGKKDYCKEDGSNADTCDHSCVDEFDNDETYSAQCDDGFDNDVDGKTDYCDGTNPTLCDPECLSIYDDHETKKVLFTFFVDTSGSMAREWADPTMVHQDLIRTIINGTDTVDGINEVMGSSAYYALGTSDSTVAARKAYFPAGKADHFLKWLDCSSGWEACADSVVDDYSNFLLTTDEQSATFVQTGDMACSNVGSTCESIEYNCGHETGELEEWTVATVNGCGDSAFASGCVYRPVCEGMDYDTQIEDCDVEFSCGEPGLCYRNYCEEDSDCFSGECSPIGYYGQSPGCTLAAPVCSSPYYYTGSSAMALRVYDVFSDASTIYNAGLTKTGEVVEFTNHIYIVLTDAADTDEIDKRNSTISLTNENNVPIHIIYIKSGDLASTQFNFWYRYHGLCEGQVCSENKDCAACKNSTSCLNACVDGSCASVSPDPTVCVNSNTHQGVWMQGDVANLEAQLPALMYKFTTLPPPPVPVLSEDAF